jgi:hypothetical protein
MGEGPRHQPNQQSNTRVSCKACKEQLETLKRICLNSSIALDYYIGQEPKGPTGSSRVVSELCIEFTIGFTKILIFCHTILLESFSEMVIFY